MRVLVLDTREWTAPGKEQRPHGQTVRHSLDSGQGSQLVCGGESKGGGECGPSPDLDWVQPLHLEHVRSTAARRLCMVSSKVLQMS